MKQSKKTTLALTEHEHQILSLTAERNGISMNDVMRHLIVYQGLCGGSFPLTTKILSMPPIKRRIIEEKIVERLKSDQALKPQSFQLWLKEAFGNATPDAADRGTDAFIRELLE